MIYLKNVFDCKFFNLENMQSGSGFRIKNSGKLETIFFLKCIVVNIFPETKGLFLIAI